MSVSVGVTELIHVVTLVFSEQREATVSPCIGVTRRGRAVLSHRALNPPGLARSVTRQLLTGPLQGG